MISSIYNYVASWFKPEAQAKKMKVYLTVKQVAEILNKLDDPDKHTNTVTLAEEYGVSQSYISKIRGGTHYLFEKAVEYNIKYKLEPQVEIVEDLIPVVPRKPKKPVKRRKRSKTYKHLNKAEVLEIESILTNTPNVLHTTIKGTYMMGDSTMSRIANGTHTHSSNKHRASVLAKG